VAIEDRLVKVPMGVDLIRDMDEAITSGAGGFRSRSEFISEAVRNLLLEQRFADADAPEGVFGVSNPGASQTRGNVKVPVHTGPRIPVISAEALGEVTRLAAPISGYVMQASDAIVSSSRQLGIHNRDFPSLWAATRLAEWTLGKPRPFAEFIREVTLEAWAYAEVAQEFVPDGMRYATALFPTNPLKRQAAERRFQDFAIGVLSRDESGALLARGPLLGWSVCQVQDGGAEPLIGITEEGWRLLDRVAGISLATPHNRGAAEAFMDHLQLFASEDWLGMMLALRGAAREMDRRELAELFRTELGGTPAVAGTNASGFVGRCREWGLLAPELYMGAYGLSDFGREYFEAHDDGQGVSGE
jgi:hypothetical protein